MTLTDMKSSINAIEAGHVADVPPAHYTTATAAVSHSRTESSRAEFIRLPHPGQRCPLTSMSRSALNGLILSTPENDFKPPVKSFVIRKRGARTGIRLIDYDSLVSFIRSHVELGKAQA